MVLFNNKNGFRIHNKVIFREIFWKQFLHQTSAVCLYIYIYIYGNILTKLHTFIIEKWKEATAIIHHNTDNW